jgi:hypothetical protein
MCCRESASICLCLWPAVSRVAPGVRRIADIDPGGCRLRGTGPVVVDDRLVPCAFLLVEMVQLRTAFGTPSESARWRPARRRARGRSPGGGHTTTLLGATRKARSPERCQEVIVTRRGCDALGVVHAGKTCGWLGPPPVLGSATAVLAATRDRDVVRTLSQVAGCPRNALQNEERGVCRQAEDRQPRACRGADWAPQNRPAACRQYDTESDHGASVAQSGSIGGWMSCAIRVSSNHDRPVVLRQPIEGGGGWGALERECRRSTPWLSMDGQPSSEPRRKGHGNDEGSPTGRIIAGEELP